MLTALIFLPGVLATLVVAIIVSCLSVDDNSDDS